MNPDQRNIGLCLSGGGARGFAHLGVLQAFDELNLEIGMISGSSAGAVAAAFYASGYSPQKSLEIILERKFWQYVSFRPSKWGLLSMSKTATILRKHFPDNSFSSLKIPVAVCTTNISRGVPTYFSEGELIPPLLASISVPILFRPVIIQGDKHIDGGLSNNLPLEPLTSVCDYLVAVNVTPFEKRLPVKSAKDILLKSVYISLDHQTSLKSVRADLCMVPEGIIHFDGFKMKHADLLFRKGYDSAMKVFKEHMPGHKG